MRLLIVTQYFWPEAFRINDLALELRRQGVEVEVLTGKPNYPEGQLYPGYRAAGMQREDFHGIPVFRVPILARGQRSGVRLALNYLSFVVSGSLLGTWLLRGRRYDAIFVFAPSPILKTLPALLLGSIKAAPVALWVQDLWPESLSATGYVRNARVLRAVESVVRFIYRKVDLLLVQSRAFEAPVKAMAPNREVVYLPNPMDAVFSEEVEPRSAYPAGNSGFRVLFAGNIGAAQAVEVIVGAAALLRERADIAFVIAGDGSRLAWMKAEAERLALGNLDFLGRLPLTEMPALMRSSSALLVTLADDPIFRLTIPSKVQAYMAAGRPILAALAGEGARVVQEAGAGVAVPPANAQALADAVSAMADMPDAQRSLMGENGRQYAQTHFDLGRVAAAIRERLESMAISRKGGT